MTRIGLPRALAYYEYEPLWTAFFQALGARVVRSRPTTRATVDLATSRATTDLCLPAKVYLGHVMQLADSVDLIFVPSLRGRVPDATHCAKIVGLPDLARRLLPNPEQLLSVELELDQGPLALGQTAWLAGRALTWNPVQIARAAEEAWAGYQETAETTRLPTASSPDGLTLAVVGHPYLLQDDYVNHRLLHRLGGLGVRVLTPDMLPEGAADRAVRARTGEAYWAYAASLLGAGAWYLETEAIDGLVAVMAFGCAPDSGLVPMLEQAAREARVPMLPLTLDEHSGEAGLVTRLEAFVDMLERKRIRR
jgi:predicted nucleotide-binding protein (sugar kinase/HSP70/actin superfamily)